MSSSSSEEEIFSTRHKRQAANDLAHLFDEESTVSEEYVQPVYDHILMDFFGTGEEYSTTKINVEEHSEKVEMLTVDCERILKYESRASSLLKGDSIMLAFLHRNTEFAGHKKFMEFIDVNKRINEYLKLEQMKIDPKYATFEDCIAMHNFSYDNNSIVWKLILSPECLYENALIGQRIHEPVEPNASVTEIITNQKMIDDIISIYSSHPLFISTIVHVATLDVNPLDALSRFFLYNASSSLPGNLGSFDTFDDLRIYILKRSIESIGCLEQKQSHRNNQAKKREAFKDLVDSTLDKILTGGKPLEENEHGMGIFYHKNILHCSIIDFKGRCIKYFQTRDASSLQKNEMSFYAIGSFDKGIKNMPSQIPDVMVVDLELVYALYDINDFKAFSTGIARRVSQIEIEYVRACTNKVGIRSDILSTDECMDAFELGTRLGLALIGIDVNKLRFNEYSHVVAFINLDSEFVEQLIAYGAIMTLDQLVKTGILMQNTYGPYISEIVSKRPSSINSIFERVNDFDNACVYLRAPTLLDRTLLHPINYTFAKILCNAVLEEQNTAIEMVLRDPNILNIDMTDIRKIDPQMDWISECITHSSRQQIDSVPDQVIHEEIYGRLKGMMEGRVRFIGKGFLFVDGVVKWKNLDLDPLYHRERNTLYFNYSRPVENPDDEICTVDVFVKKDNEEYFQNQYVSVNLIDPAFSSMSYNGTLVSQSRQKRLKFIDHPLFYNLSAKRIEQEMHNSNKTIAIRKSGQGPYGIVTLRLFIRDMEVFQHIKFEEIDNKVSCKNIFFDDVDEMIVYFCRKLRIFDSLRKYKGDVNFELVMDQPGIVKVVLKRGHTHKSEAIKIENVILLGNKKFRTVEEYLKYRMII